MIGWAMLVGSALVLIVCVVATATVGVRLWARRDVVDLDEFLVGAVVLVAPPALGVLVVGLLKVWG